MIEMASGTIFTAIGAAGIDVHVVSSQQRNVEPHFHL